MGQATTNHTPTVQADYWYRCEDDPDQSVRESPQMTASAADVPRTVRDLRAQGYHVQKAEVYVLCNRCQGHGKIGLRPKGTRKTAVLPAWRLVWKTCPSCEGQPELYRHAATLPEAELIADAQQNEGE